MRIGLKLVGRLILTIGSICLLWWAFPFNGSSEDRSAFIQACFALIIIWATWKSIDNSDKQIKHSDIQVGEIRKQNILLNKQIKMAEEEFEKSNLIAITVEPKTDSVNKTITFDIVNISAYPIYISSVSLWNSVEYSQYDGDKLTWRGHDFSSLIRLSPSDRVVQSTSHLNLELISKQDAKKLYDYSASDTHARIPYGHGLPTTFFNWDRIDIKLYYGGSPGKSFTRSFKLSLERRLDEVSQQPEWHLVADPVEEA